MAWVQWSEGKRASTDAVGWQREPGPHVRNLHSSESLHRVQTLSLLIDSFHWTENTARTVGSAKLWDESSDIWGVLFLTENMKRMLFLTAWCLWRKVKPWESKLLLWCCTSNTLKLEPESLWGDKTTTDWNRRAAQESIGRTANNPSMKYCKYVISWRQSYRGQIIAWYWDGRKSNCLVEASFPHQPVQEPKPSRSQSSRLPSRAHRSEPYHRPYKKHTVWEDTADRENELKVVS